MFTHAQTHANYEPSAGGPIEMGGQPAAARTEEEDAYGAHRLAQAYELARFIRAEQLDGSAADLVVLAADLNLTPASLGYRLLRALTGLRDAWTEMVVCFPRLGGFK